MAKDEKKDADGKKDTKEKKEPPKPPPTAQEVLYRNIFLLDKYAETRDLRFLSRVLRYTKFLRQHLPTSQLRAAVDTYVPDAGRKAALNSLISVAAERRKEPEAPKAAAAAEAPASSSSAMEVEAPAASSSSTSSSSSSSSSSVAAGDKSAAASLSSSSSSPSAAAAAAVKPPKPNPGSAPEVDAYLQLVALGELQAQGRWDALAAGCDRLLAWLGGHNRRTLDFFTARGYSMLALAAEHGAPLLLIGTGSASGEGLVPALLAAHRSACLRHDEYGQATLLNLVLREYINASAFDAAAKLLAKASFPEGASPAQLCRYLFYKGRVQAVTLDYSDAHASLTQALRKAPPSALGFRTIATKFALVAQLLTGEVPDRATFSAPDMKAALAPYYELTSSVRLGDLGAFSAAVAKHGPGAFTKDHTLSLVQRLETNVIKTGLRALAVAYSRISFRDIAAKLGLGSPEDAEFLCAKAIRDGVLDAVLDHEAGAMTSREVTNVYATREPQEAFHRRIGFCLDVHTEAVKGLRYPPGALKGDLESAEARREREREEDELAKEIEEGGLDDEED